ncbi:dihydroorotase [Negadavirga shengliensis]|uniref:Dihydroorotase n=1 Tax=Negadavirga shengliensis TaxID=1389218 RepID=A0ABV9T2N3_9BACT
MSVIFQSLKIITDKEILEPADYVFDGKSIQLQSSDTDTGDATRIDCTGLLGSEGWIDLRCFAGEPGLEHRETLESLGACLKNAGIVEAVLLPNTFPPVQSKNEVSYIQSRAKDFLATIHVQAAVTKNMEGEDLTEMLDLYHNGVRIFGEGLVPLSHSDRMMKALQYLQKFNGTLFDHSYDPLMAIFGHMHEGVVSTTMGVKGIPDIAEEVAVRKNLEILRYAGGHLHFQTLSTIGAVEQIRQAKQEGLSVTADVSLYQLLFTDTDLTDFDTSLKVLPPFREQAQKEALVEGLKDGTIDAIVSNHVPHDYDAKNMEFDLAPFGMAGLQTFVPALVELEPDLGYPLLISKLTKGPAKVLKKASTSWDSLTVFDPHAEWEFDQPTNPSPSSNSPWFGKGLKGSVKFVVNKGKFEEVNV